MKGEKTHKRMDGSVCKTTDCKAQCWLFKSNADLEVQHQEKKDAFTRRQLWEKECQLIAQWVEEVTLNP